MQIIFFDVDGAESARATVPASFVRLRVDYAYTVFKFRRLHAVNPKKYDSWDTVRI